MKSQLTSKQEYLSEVIQKIRQSPSKVVVNSICYSCLFSGKTKHKTLVLIPDELEMKGIITINKPLEEVEMLDLLKLYKRFKAVER